MGFIHNDRRKSTTYCGKDLQSTQNDVNIQLGTWNVPRELFNYCTKEGFELDEYLKVSAVFHLSDSGDFSKSGAFVNKVQRKVMTQEFGNIFKNACDELKQNSGTHTKTGVITLS